MLEQIVNQSKFHQEDGGLNHSAGHLTPLTFLLQSLVMCKKQMQYLQRQNQNL